MATKDLPPDCLRILRNADAEAKRLCNPEVTPLHLAEAIRRKDDENAFPAESSEKLDLALAALPTSYSSPVHEQTTMQMLQQAAEDEDPQRALISTLTELLKGLPTPPPSAGPAKEPPPAPAPDAPEKQTTQAESGVPQRLAPFVTQATDIAPILPRRAEVNRIVAMIGAREPQPVLLLAEEGSGGSTMADCLSSVLAVEGYDGPLAGYRVLKTSTPGLLEGTAADVRSLGAVEGDFVVFVDDVEVLLRLGSGAADYQMLATMRGLIDTGRPLVFALSTSFYDRLQAVDNEFVSELEPLRLPPLSDADVLLIAESEARAIAEFHRVEVPDSLVALAAAPPRQIDTMTHPGLAVARLDRAAAAARLRADRVANPEDLGSAVSAQQYLAFDAQGAFERLRDQVLGQDDAIRTIVDRLAVTRASLDMAPERPDGVFLFAGPTGTGKTALALALADEIYESSGALTRLDMSEFAEEHTVSKLYGSPPGYVGSTEPESWLTTQIRKRPQSLLLLDEIEKAHPLVWNAFLQVFDVGRMTDTQGRTAEFSDVVIIMTTNMGAEEFAKQNDIGFGEHQASAAAQESGVREELKRRMRPELLNRVDGVLVFHPLDAGTVREIARHRLADVLVRLQDRGWNVTLDPSVEDSVVQLGYDSEYGARPMIRAIERVVLRPVAAHPQGNYRLSVSDGETVVEPQ